MGVFGKGREIQFFMTDKDQRLYLDKIKKDWVSFIKGDIFSISKKLILSKDIPKECWPTRPDCIQFFIYNKELGELKFEIVPQTNSNMLIMGKSPVIQFLRSYIPASQKVMLNGWLSAMLSWKSLNSKDQFVETLQSEEFVKWWNEVSKTLKKMCVKCYALDPITHKKSSFPMWMGPDAVYLYKKGFKFQQSIYDKFPQITFHPEDNSG